MGWQSNGLTNDGQNEQFVGDAAWDKMGEYLDLMIPKDMEEIFFSDLFANGRQKFGIVLYQSMIVRRQINEIYIHEIDRDMYDEEFIQTINFVLHTNILGEEEKTSIVTAEPNVEPMSAVKLEELMNRE